MDKEEFEKFRQELARAFENREPNTECFEVVRLLSRLPVRFQQENRELWISIANPERFFEKSPEVDDTIFMSACAYMCMHVILMGEFGFDPSPEEIAFAEKADDIAFEEGFFLRPDGMN